MSSKICYAFMQTVGIVNDHLVTCFRRNQKKFIQADYENRLFDHLALEVKDMDRQSRR